MKFSIDEKARRSLSFKTVGATTGGKIALTFCSICTVLFFVSLYFMIHYWDAERNTDEIIKLGIAMLAFGTFLMAGPIGFIITYRQRNLRVSMRTNERLFIEDGWLRYSFHLSGDRDVSGLNDIVINLRECDLQLGSNGECVFTGGIFGWHYQNISLDRPRSIDEMEPIPTFEIGSYWSPNLYETLIAEQQRLVLNDEENINTRPQQSNAEESSNTPVTTSETVRAFVDVSKKSRPLVAFACCLVAFLLVCAVVWGLSVGRLYSLVVLIPLVYVIGSAKRAVSSSETKIVWVTLTISERSITIDMPNSRIYNKEYVDQRYVCGRDFIDSVILDGQIFRLRAQSMQNVVFCTGAQLALENLTYVEVSFRLDADGMQRVGRLFTENGYTISSVT